MKGFILEGWKVHRFRHWDCDYEGRIRFARTRCGISGPAKKTHPRLPVDCCRCKKWRPR